MMFNKDVSTELQDILEIELHRYKREIGHMTKEEWNLLVNWVTLAIVPTPTEMASLTMMAGLLTS